MELVLVAIYVIVLKYGLEIFVITVSHIIVLAIIFNIYPTAVCIPHCGHGTCIQPDVCVCDPGWTGLRCTVG